MSVSELTRDEEVIRLLHQNDIFELEDFESITLSELTDILGCDKSSKSLKKTLESKEIYLKQSDAGVTFRKRMGLVRDRELTM
jgi:hypothetical protein